MKTGYSTGNYRIKLRGVVVGGNRLVASLVLLDIVRLLVDVALMYSCLGIVSGQFLPPTKMAADGQRGK